MHGGTDVLHVLVAPLEGNLRLVLGLQVFEGLNQNGIWQGRAKSRGLFSAGKGLDSPSAPQLVPVPIGMGLTDLRRSGGV